MFRQSTFRIFWFVVATVLLGQSYAWSVGLSWGPVVEEKADNACVVEENPSITPGPMRSPFRFYEMDENTLLVSDRSGSVYKVGKSTPDEPELLFEVEGAPLGIAVYGKSILIGNESTGKVEAYRPRGKRVSKRMLFPRSRSQKIQPLDIGVDLIKALFFVVDGFDGHIKVYNRRGRLTQTIGGFGQLVRPQALAVDPLAEEVIVSDYGDQSLGISASIQVFDYSGRHIKTIRGAFSRPQGISHNKQSVYVVDAVLGQVLEFDRQSGSQLAKYGCFGSSDGHLMLPMDVFFDVQLLDLFVADNRNGRVTVLPSMVQ